ncbi:MAG: GAF domain-containing protein [Chloroflexia bacterium]|nr:GAF domain-containing protein [Chloroflexia bacterium]
MTDARRGSSPDLLAEAQATITQQADELERLRRRLDDERFAEELRRVLVLAAAAGTIASPMTHARLLEHIVETAADVIGARAGALLLVDEARNELTFEVAIGPKAAEVKRIRVPLGQGVAGLVAISGQPMAIADAGRDPRHASDIARQVGYYPESILCVPLVYGDRLTGVLELLDKDGAPAFSAADMHSLGLFANQAAVAIEQSRTLRNVATLTGELLRTPDAETGAALAERARQFAARIEADDAAAGQALDLAALVQEITWYGEHEREACRTILRAFADYLRQRPDSMASRGTLP